MSTDSTELTFVRCPACRSLVPAVSTRCRMCGATLDAAAQKVEEPPRDSQKSGRVRQRTTSVAGSDLSAAAGLIRQEMGVSVEEPLSPEGVLAAEAAGAEPPPESPVAEPSSFSGSVSTSATQDDDPLSAYIQEVEVDEPATNGNAAHSHGDASPVSRAEAKVEPAPKAPEAPVARGSESAERREQPRVIIETGPRKSNKPSNLSFGGGRPKEEESRASPSDEAGWQPVGGGRENVTRDAGSRDRARQGQPSSASPGREARGNEQRQGAPRPDQRGPDQRGDRQPQDRQSQERPAQDRQGGGAQQGRRQDQRDQRPQREQRSGREEAAQSGVEFSQAQTGRLVGWLVSYADPRGTASELREGRFFFSGAPLKPHDVVIDDPSISTPHALVAVGLSDGLRVQDLMSDRGVWVKRRGQEGFQRVTDAVKLDHGDWLRLGEVEFMVCLLAGTGSK